jgi:AcrR family transcriptional regulator
MHLESPDGLRRLARCGNLLNNQLEMPALSETPTRRRDAARSRHAILGAAERLFAERGYEATTMADIASAAGLSTGTPSYFYESKEQLYRAVLSRAFAEMGALIRSRQLGHGDPVATITETVSSYIAFLTERPNFVRLVVRECLDGGRFLTGLSEHLAALTETLQGLAAESARGTVRPDIDLRHLLLSGISLCWFPMVATPVSNDLDLAPETAEFVAARQEQVARLILHGALRDPESFEKGR